MQHPYGGAELDREYLESFVQALALENFGYPLDAIEIREALILAYGGVSPAALKVAFEVYRASPRKGDWGYVRAVALNRHARATLIKEGTLQA